MTKFQLTNVALNETFTEVCLPPISSQGLEQTLWYNLNKLQTSGPVTNGGKVR